MSLIGCNRYVIIHPIEKSDIFRINKGAVITQEGHTLAAEKDGYFLSDLYIQEVAKAKIQ